MPSPPLADLTAETQDVLERRWQVVQRMFAGEATYDDVLAFHAEDFVWLSPAGVKVGRDAAREHHEARMQRIPPEALAGTRMLRQEAAGEYAFNLFKTGAVPFGTDTYRVVGGKVVFQSNALYLPRA